MTNRRRPHVLVLPEDRANSEIINGFLLESVPPENEGKIQVLQEACGWSAVIDRFCHNEAQSMRRYDQRFMILVLDFDDDPKRMAKVKSRIPADLVERVFVLGVRSEPEALKRKMRQNFEAIGSVLARDCQSGGEGIWLDELLAHNAEELGRIKQAGLHELLFQSI